MATPPCERIVAFAHIGKTAGMTMQLVLRQSFGVRHLDVSQRTGRTYTARDFAVDMRRFPFLRSIAGHGLKPFVDYPHPGRRLAWFTFVREPIARFVSHYQHHVEQMHRSVSLEDFVEESIQANRQVQHLAGEQDLAAAKQIVRERLDCVGRVDRFHELLLLLRERLGLRGFRPYYGRPKNEAHSRDRTRRIRDEVERLRDRVLEKNQLDLAFYDWIVKEVYPRQVAEYGAERLAGDAGGAFAATRRSLGDGVRQLQSAALRKGVYVPSLRAGAAMRRVMGAFQQDPTPSGHASPR